MLENILNEGQKMSNNKSRIEGFRKVIRREMKRCRTCKFFKLSFLEKLFKLYDDAGCGRNKMAKRIILCSVERGRKDKNGCGENAKYYEGRK